MKRNRDESSISAAAELAALNEEYYKFRAPSARDLMAFTQRIQSTFTRLLEAKALTPQDIMGFLALGKTLQEEVNLSLSVVSHHQNPSGSSHKASLPNPSLKATLPLTTQPPPVKQSITKKHKATTTPSQKNVPRVQKNDTTAGVKKSVLKPEKSSPQREMRKSQSVVSPKTSGRAGEGQQVEPRPRPPEFFSANKAYSVEQMFDGASVSRSSTPIKLFDQKNTVVCTEDHIRQSEREQEIEAIKRKVYALIVKRDAIDADIKCLQSELTELEHDQLQASILNK